MSEDTCVSRLRKRQLWKSADFAVYSSQLNEENLVISIIWVFEPGVVASAQLLCLFEEI